MGTLEELEEWLCHRRAPGLADPVGCHHRSPGQPRAQAGYALVEPDADHADPIHPNTDPTLFAWIWPLAMQNLQLKKMKHQSIREERKEGVGREQKDGMALPLPSSLLARPASSSNSGGRER